jgi:hypothetical protein
VTVTVTAVTAVIAMMTVPVMMTATVRRARVLWV